VAAHYTILGLSFKNFAAVRLNDCRAWGKIPKKEEKHPSGALFGQIVLAFRFYLFF
jgi:hypothetical protein